MMPMLGQQIRFHFANISISIIPRFTTRSALRVVSSRQRSQNVPELSPQSRHRSAQRGNYIRALSLSIHHPNQASNLAHAPLSEPNVSLNFSFTILVLVHITCTTADTFFNPLIFMCHRSASQPMKADACTSGSRPTSVFWRNTVAFMRQLGLWVS